MTDRAFHPSTLVFLDTEYTSLDLRLAQVWNIGLVIREPDGSEVAEEVIVTDLNFQYADPASLEIGHFWQRHPDVGGKPGSALLMDARKTAHWLLERLAPDIADDGTAVGRHIVGCNPIGDVTLLRELVHCTNLPWPAHYHVICAEAMAIGALRARGVEVPIPFSSAFLSEHLGVEPTPADEKHTALGDARWAARLYDAASQPRLSSPSALATLLLERALGLIGAVDDGNWTVQRPKWRRGAEEWCASYREGLRATAAEAAERAA